MNTAGTTSAAPAAEERLLYERLADGVGTSIELGTLAPGERLPGVRAMAERHGVSVSTVVQAYQVLESRGLVEARPQSGHYVRFRRPIALPEPNVAAPQSSAAEVSVGDLVARIYKAFRDPAVIALGSAVPDPGLLPTDRINRVMATIAREAGAAGVSYDPPPGYLPLRRVIARRAADLGVALAPDDVVITVGCMEALHLCLRAVVRDGDAVAVETPTYYGLLQLLESHRLRVYEIPAHPRTGMDLARLETVLSRRRVKAVVAVPSFNNPLGSLLPEESRPKLASLLARHDVPLIEDDVYGDLYYGERRTRPVKAFDRKGLIMLCSSFSKTIAPGYRVGWVAPGRFRERVEQLKFAQTVATMTLAEMAIADFLENGGYDRHLRHMRRKLAEQVACFSAAVAEHFPAGTRVSRPQGGFVLWIELPENVSGLELMSRALAERISIAPGPLFSAKQRFTSCIRISCGRAWTDLTAHAVRTVGRIATELAG